MHITTKTRCAIRSSNVDTFQTSFESHLTAAARTRYGELESLYIYDYLSASHVHDVALVLDATQTYFHTLIRDNYEPPSCQTPTPRQRLLEIICQLSSSWLLKLNRYRHFNSNHKTLSSRRVEVAQSALSALSCLSVRLSACTSRISMYWSDFR